MENFGRNKLVLKYSLGQKCAVFQAICYQQCQCYLCVCVFFLSHRVTTMERLIASQFGMAEHSFTGFNLLQQMRVGSSSNSYLDQDACTSLTRAEMHISQLCLVTLYFSLLFMTHPEAYYSAGGFTMLTYILCRLLRIVPPAYACQQFCCLLVFIRYGFFCLFCFV